MSTYEKLSALPEDKINELLSQCTEISERELETQFDDMLDDCFGDVTIGGHEYAHSNALKRVDPIAYREGFLNYIDSRDDLLEFGGWYYNAEEIETLLETI